jgi:hypothetical protein
MDVGALDGSISIEDQFSSTFESAIHYIQAFGTEYGGMVAGVTVGAAAIVTAVAGITAAITALGVQGSEVNDLKTTMDHFAGSAQAADEILQALSTGTKGTVANFGLMQEASRLMSANVKLNTADFQTLGEAAFVLQNRGLGGTKEMLDLVSTALVTGRTRALAMKLGVVDTEDATSNYAHSLGLATDELTKAQVAEGTRITVMNMLKSAVADATDTQRDFGEQVEYATAQVKNWVEDVASATAASPVLAAAVNGIFTAFQQAFGPSRADSIKMVTAVINECAVIVLDVGIAAVGVATVFNTTWSAIKTVVLGVETVILGMLAGIGEALVAAEALAAKLHLVDPSEVERIQATTDGLKTMTLGLAEQTNEAARGVIGQNAFGQTLTKVGGALFAARDAAVSAQAATEGHTAATDKNAVSAGKAATAVAGHTKAENALIDSFLKAKNSLDGVTVAFDSLTKEQKANKAVQDTVLPLLDKMIAAGIPLTQSETDYYKSVLATTQALTLKQTAALSEQGVTLGQIESLKQQGLSEANIAFQLNTTVVALKSYTTALSSKTQLEMEALKTVTELWDTYNASVLKTTGTTLDQQYAAIEDWANKQSEKIEEVAIRMHMTAQDTTQFYKNAYGALASTIAAKYAEVEDAVGTSTQAVRDSTQNALQQIADVAAKKYQEAIQHVGEWSDATIQAAHDTWEQAQLAADGWGTSVANTIDSVVTPKINQVLGQIKSVSSEMSAMASTFSLVGSATPSGIYGKLTQQQLSDYGFIDNKGYITQAGAQAGYGTYGAGLGHNAAGTDDWRGGPTLVGELGPEVVDLPQHTKITPNNKLGGGDTYITVKGVFGTIQQVKDAINAANLAASGRKFGRA